MKADATLVAAGYRLGQSYVPKDYSEIFRIQYEGLAKAHEAKAEAAGNVWKNLAKEFEEYGEFKRKEDDDGEKIKDVSEHFETGGDFSPGHLDGAERYLDGLKTELEGFRKKLVLGKDERKRKKQIKKEIAGFRNNWNRSRGSLLASGKAWRDGHANTELSFRGEPDLQMLYAQVIDPSSNFDEKEVRVEWENGEKVYYYSSDRIGIEARSISGGKVEDSPLSSPPVKPENWKKITEKDLLSRIKYKDKKTELALNGIDKKVLDQVNSQVKNSKTLSVGEFSDIEDKVTRDYKDAFLQSDNIQDLTTRNLLIGNKEYNYLEDRKNDLSIDVAIIDNMGLESEFTKEQLEDGKITIDEFNSSKKHQRVKGQILEMLTNPKGGSQREIAANAYAQYRTNIIKETFNGERTRINDDPLNNPVIDQPTTTTTLFGKKVPIASTTDERKTFAIVNNIAEGKPEVTVKGATYTYNPKTELYSYLVPGENEDDALVRTTITREALIQRASEVYGNIPSNYFTTGMNTKLKGGEVEGKVINVVQKGKILRIKDVEKRGDDWYVKGTKAKLKKKYYDQLNKIYIPK